MNNAKARAKPRGVKLGSRAVLRLFGSLTSLRAGFWQMHQMTNEKNGFVFGGSAAVP